jgi:uncharacterized membrane protein YphA (DoxX/SURF4 family)
MADLPGLALSEVSAPTLLAHVKWFHDFSYSDSPLGLSDALTPLVIAMTIISALAVGSLVIVDRLLARSAVYGQVAAWLQARRDQSVLVMRIGAGMTLLLSWQADAMLAPELDLPYAWIGWVQFALALMLIFPRLTPAAGVGIVALWLGAAVEFGLFHMLDYVLFIGVGVYLAVSASKSERVNGLGVPALYLTLGFSLIWVALEKVIYPDWGLGVLSDKSQLTLGIPDDTFLILVAFTELALGFLLVIGLLGRPLGLVITLVLFTTALVFGKTEVVGHTIIHASLIVFLLEGQGRFYPAPITVHRSLAMRFAFASVNFLIVTAVLFGIYEAIARLTYENAA